MRSASDTVAFLRPVLTAALLCAPRVVCRVQNAAQSHTKGGARLNRVLRSALTPVTGAVAGATARAANVIRNRGGKLCRGELNRLLERRPARVRGILAVLGAALVAGLVLALRPLNLIGGRLGALGYLGAFLAMFTSYATVCFPLPGLGVVLSLGLVLDPLVLAISGGLGGAAGEMTGYLVGYGATTVLGGREVRLLRKVQRWFRTKAFLTILCLSLIPNPGFDVVGILAGAVKYPVWRFFLACALGNVGKCFYLSLLARGAGKNLIGWFL